MERETTSNRLKQIMQERNLKQVDILNLTLPICKKYNVKMNKSDISQYVSGKVEPSQEKLSVLGMALNVTETWLMGFDATRERSQNSDKSIPILEQMDLWNAIKDDKEMVKALDKYLTLSEEKKKHVINTIYMLSEEET